MTLDELYQKVKDLKDQNVPGDTKVFVSNCDCDNDLVECDYVAYWKDGESDEPALQDGLIEIG